MTHLTTASGAGVDEFAAIQSTHAFNTTGRTALSAITTDTKPKAHFTIFKNLTFIQPQVANDFADYEPVEPFD